MRPQLMDAYCYIVHDACSAISITLPARADVFCFHGLFSPAKSVNRLALSKQENYKFEYLCCHQSNLHDSKFCLIILSH